MDKNGCFLDKLPLCHSKTDSINPVIQTTGRVLLADVGINSEFNKQLFPDLPRF